MPDTMLDTREAETGSEEDRHDKWMLDIVRDADLVTDQIDSAQEDMRFVNVIGGQWEGFNEEEFDDRTKLEFDLVNDFNERFIGEFGENPIGVEFRPDDDKASDKDAEMLSGIYRADYENNSGDIAWENAVREVATCGYGCVKMATIHEDDEDPKNEFQRIEFRPVHNAYNSVFWDRSAKRIDKADARWCTVLTGFSKDAFEEKYPDNLAVSAYEPDGSTISRFSENAMDQIFVATRYEVIKEKQKIFLYNDLENGEVVWFDEEEHEDIKDELADNSLMRFVRERTITVRRVEKTVFSGAEVLEPTKRIAGKWIPIIPIYGYRAFVDGSEWYRGLVRNLKDANRLFNMLVSQIAETSASGGQRKPIFDPKQVEGESLQNIWKKQNRAPYFLARALRNKAGDIVNAGPIGYVEPPSLDENTKSLVDIINGYMRDRTGGMPQDVSDPNASGKAIRAILKRVNLNTQTIKKNIANAYKQAGRVYTAMAGDIYTVERMVRTLGKDGTEGRVRLLQTIQDSKTGKMVHANNLAGKKFRVHIDIGPGYETQKEESVENLKGVAEILVQMGSSGEQFMPAVVAELIQKSAGTGLDSVKKMARRFLLAQGLEEPRTDEEIEFVQQAQQPKPDENKELIEALANKENAEARNLEAGITDKLASASKKAAETAQIQAEIEPKRAKTLAEIRNMVRAATTNN